MNKHPAGQASPRNRPRRLWQWCKGAGATLLLTVLAACGGGDDAAETSTAAPVVQGALVSGVVVPSSSDASATTVTTSGDGSGLVLSNLSGGMQSIKDGQVVMLPANEAQGLPLGYTGKATLQSDGTVKLAQATVADVFKTLKVDFDSARDGGQVVGLIVPEGGKMSISQSPAANQTGLDWTLCQFGLQVVVDVKCSNGALKGSITLEHPIKVKSKDGKAESMGKLYATIGLDKLSVKAKIDFDETKYLSTGGFNLLETGLSGEWSASIGVKLDDDKFSASIPAWSELVMADGNNIWDENTKVKFGKHFELSGLNGDDKKGLIPLGGIYLTPAAAVSGVPFVGDLSAAQLGRIKAMGTVVLVYMDLSGNLTLSGDLKFLEATGGGFSRGFKMQRVNGEMVSKVVDQKTDVNVFAPRIKGKIEASQNIGLGGMVDVLVAGIRPASIKTTLIAVNLSATTEGEGGYRWSPQPTGLEGSLCSSMGVKVLSSIEVNAQINAQINANWVGVPWKYRVGFGYQYGPEEGVWWEKSTSACVNSFTLPLNKVGMMADEGDPTKTKVTMSFADAYNNAALRAQVGRWQIYEEGPLQTKFYDADTSFGGEFTVPLAPGNYTFTVLALHKDLLDGAGKPLVVAQSSSVPVVVTAAPVVDFTSDIVGGDCTKLKLTSTAAASGGDTLTGYTWTVKPASGAVLTQQGAALRTPTFTLPACGSVSVTLQVVDSSGRTASLVRNVNTTAYTATVTSITAVPASPTVGQLVTFSVVGKNLPPTAVLSVADASACQVLASPARSATGFTATCTMGATAGDKLITIKTDTQANGGKVVDATKSVTVSGTVVTTGKLPDTGITASQCYAAGSDTLVSCTSAAAIALNAKQDGMITPGSAGMSYSLVGSYSKEECVKDNITGLTWEGKPTSGLRAAGNAYTNYDSTTAAQVWNGSTSVNPTQAQIDATTNTVGYVAAVNATKLCGYSDWRLPTLDELQSIVDYSVAYPGPTIDSTWFPNTQQSVYWTGTGYAGYSGDAWVVSFGYGYVYYSSRYSLHVRLVR